MGNVVSINDKTSPLNVPESLTLLQMAREWKVWVRIGSVSFRDDSGNEICSSGATIAFFENNGEVNAYQKAEGENDHLYNWIGSVDAGEGADDSLLDALFQGGWYDE